MAIPETLKTIVKDIWANSYARPIILGLSLGLALALVVGIFNEASRLKEWYDAKQYAKAQQALQEKVTASDAQASAEKSRADSLNQQAEGIKNELADKQKQIDAANAAYADALRRAVAAGKSVPRGPVAPGAPRPDDSDDALCKRANSLGVSCVYK
jgi:hypothetical protein